MHIAICSPVSLKLLRPLLRDADDVPVGYDYPLAAHLCEHLLQLGHEISVVTSSTDVRTVSEWSGPGLRVIVTPRRRHYLFCLDGYKQEVEAMKRCIDACAPDVVHAQWTYEFAAAGIRSGLPCLVTPRDSPWAILAQTRSLYRFYRLLYAKRVLRGVRDVTFASQYLKEEYVRHGYEFRSATIVPNAVTDGFLVSKPREHPARSHGRVTCVAGLGPRKNVENALCGFQAARRRWPGLSLKLVGGGLVEQGDFAIAAHRRGLAANVKFVGHLDNRSIMQVLRHETDVFVCTSREESFGMVVLEAMASSLPIVAGKKSGAVPWLLDYGKAGILVDVENPDAIAQGLLSMLRDPCLARQYGATAHERAKQHFTWDTVADKYCRAYGNILRTAGARPWGAVSRGV